MAYYNFFILLLFSLTPPFWVHGVLFLVQGEGRGLMPELKEPPAPGIELVIFSFKGF